MEPRYDKPLYNDVLGRANDIIRIIVIFYYTFLLCRLAKGTGTLMEQNLAILVNKCGVFLLHE